MEYIQRINLDRINWCCRDYGITLNELADNLKISNSAITRLTTEQSITYNQLEKIANHFGRGVLFFLEETPIDETHFHTPQFRTLANQKPELSVKLKKLIKQVEKQRDVFLSLQEDLEEPTRSQFIAPNIPANNPIESAKIIRQWLELNDTNDFDSYRKAIEAKGILVFRTNGYNGKWQIAKESPILGFNLYNEICPVIVVKKLDYESQQCFTLMHELGHVILHKKSSIDDANDLYSHQGMEKDANAFAGNLLVPKSFLDAINDNNKPDDVTQYDDWLEVHRKKWGVSTEVILRRLLDFNRLSQIKYDEYRQWRSDTSFIQEGGGNRQFRNREPKHIFGDTFVKTVFDALNAQHISLNKASSYLDSIKIKDLHLLEKHYASH